MSGLDRLRFPSVFPLCKARELQVGTRPPSDRLTVRQHLQGQAHNHMLDRTNKHNGSLSPQSLHTPSFIITQTENNRSGLRLSPPSVWLPSLLGPHADISRKRSSLDVARVGKRKRLEGYKVKDESQRSWLRF